MAGAEVLGEIWAVAASPGPVDVRVFVRGVTNYHFGLNDTPQRIIGEGVALSALAVQNLGLVPIELGNDRSLAYGQGLRIPPNALLSNGSIVSGGGGVTALERFALAALPGVGNPGRMVQLTDFDRSVWIEDGNNWRSLTGNVTSVKAYGAKDDGLTGSAASFQAAIDAAALVNGTVLVDATTGGKYIVEATVNLKPNVRIVGVGQVAPVIRFTGGATPMFKFVGVSEAQGLNVQIENLQLESAMALTGVAIRVRNFQNLQLRGVIIAGFKQGVWTDWGIGLRISDTCQLILNERAVQVGGDVSVGPVIAPGIRGGGNPAFMDTVLIEDSVFSQNQVDVNDMGSSYALGILKITANTFFEAFSAPVAGKFAYIRVCNRKGIDIADNWFECGQAVREHIYLGDFDYDGNASVMCNGAEIHGNAFLNTVAAVTSIGVDITRCEGAYIHSNNFEFAAGSRPIALNDGVSSATVGPNTFMTWPDIPGYANPIYVGANLQHAILHPLAGYVLPAVVTLAQQLYPATPALLKQAVCAIFAGTGVPNNANGANGDFYFNAAGAAGTTIYQKRAGAWVGVV